MKVEIYNSKKIKDELLKYSVIFARYNNQYIFVKHKKRITYELAGGHIELNETPNECAQRELFEETGSISFEINELFRYSVEIDDILSYGACYFANIIELGILPKSEIGEVLLFDTFPQLEKTTYPIIYKKLFKKFNSLSKPYYIYTIRCNDNSLYTGITVDFDKRLKQHENGTGAKYTKNKGPFELKRLWKTEGRSQASKFESYIKSFTKTKKELILSNPLLLNEIFPQIRLVK